MHTGSTLLEVYGVDQVCMANMEGEDTQRVDSSKKPGAKGVYDWSNEGLEQEGGQVKRADKDNSEAMGGLAFQPGKEIFKFCCF